MFSIRGLEVNQVNNQQSTVALLDVDDTLIIGNYIVDPDVEGIEQIKVKLRSKGALNLDLINALKAANIKNIYLFTDMTFNPSGLLERQALVDILKENGFIVHGVITPADCAWHLPQESLSAFVDSKDALLPKQIDSLKNEGKAEEAQQLLSTLQQNVDYQKLIIASELKGV